MKDNYRNKLFLSYSSTHVNYLEADSQIEANLDWYLRYFKENYLIHVDKFRRDTSKILEIGCNRGYLLSVFNSFGYKDLHGIDLSPDDVEKARLLVPCARIICTDAFTYLDNNNKEIFDIIILKAVLEHFNKNEVVSLLEKLKQGIKTTGIVIVDVPNMDWLFASHERYMDFTHEVGFTQESLRQVMNNVFPDVKVVPADSVYFYSFREKAKQKLAKFILKTLFSWADPQGGNTEIWARSIVGIGTK